MAEGRGLKCVVIGAGPVGALAGLYAARRGWDVEVYDLRAGMSEIDILSLTSSMLTSLRPTRGINDTPQLHKINQLGTIRTRYQCIARIGVARTVEVHPSGDDSHAWPDDPQSRQER